MKNIPKVLIVDDEINILKAIKRLLTQLEFEIFITTSPKEAFEIIKTHNIDLIISDQRMPTMAGIELLSQIKEISPGTIRILMSGYSDIEVIISAINNGSIFHYISKPWKNEEMIKIILNALDTKSDQDDQEKIFKSLFKDKGKWADLISQSKVIRRRDLINSIIHNQVVLHAGVIEEGKALGIDFYIAAYCSLIKVDYQPILELVHDEKNNIKDSLMNEIICMLSLIPNCLAWDCGGNIGVIQQLNSDDEGIILKTVSNIKEIFNNYYPNLQFIIGVSKVNIGIEGLRKSYNQANSTLIAARSQNNSDSNIAYFQDIGVLQLLTEVSGQTLAKEFVEENLGKLIQYDHDKDCDFICTLEEILKQNNLKEAASKLFIHPKTLVFRRNRIEEILGISLDSYETRLNLGIAIKLYKVNRLN